MIDDPLNALRARLEWHGLPETVERVLNEPERLEALEASGLLESAPDDVLDAFARLAAERLGAESAAISVVEPDRQVFAGRVGIDEPEMPISRSYCQYAVAIGETLAIHDSREHRILAQNEATLAGVRSYLGAPISTNDGHVIGTLCVYGREPRAWSWDDVELLTSIAHVVMKELDGRRGRRQAQNKEDIAQIWNRLQEAISGLDSAVASWDRAGILDARAELIFLAAQMNDRRARMSMPAEAAD